MSTRRQFITLLCGAAATWPVVARAQQPAMPVIGFLSPVVLAPVEHLLTLFRQTLAEAGFVEGRNVASEYRWAEGQYDRLPALAADLVRRRVTVIVASGGSAPAVAAKAATTTIPIVFSVTDDPVKLGLVASLARPGGNATGMSFLLSELADKQLGILHEFVPSATRIGVLVNPHNANAEAVVKDARTASSKLGIELVIVRASDSREIEAAFASLVRQKAGALVVGADPVFFRRRLQIATLATRHTIPAVYNAREYVQVGGLMSYGTSLQEAWRQLGTYTVRILKGARPADLPVVRSTNFEFVINLPTARALGLTVPPMLLARADEVIE